MRPLRTVIVALVIAAAATVARAVDCPFGMGALPADTLPPGTPHGSQIPIDHIVVLMQENRSFDHYFGRLYGKKSGPPRHASNPDPLGGHPIKVFHQKRYCEVADLDHGWSGTHREVDNGEMDGFTAQNVDPSDPSGSRAMGAYAKSDLRYYYKLYKTFAISDRQFCALQGPTFPNRYYLLGGTSFGQTTNVIPPLGGPEYTQRTIFNLLDEAMPPVTWRVYYSDLPFAGLFGYVRTTGLANLHPISEFYTDAAAGTLPQVSFVDPAFTGEAENDEHPPTNIQVGQAFAASIIDAVMTSPLWPSTALIHTYDEHGGYYDHVAPPAACVPDGIAPILGPNDVPGAFDAYGVRIPLVVVSPYARKHYVSHVPRDHTAILRFIETRFDLPALTARDANTDPLTDLFDFTSPTFAKPPNMPKAAIDPKRQAQCS